MGKANLHELSLGFTSTNPHFGAVRNPYNAEHVPGGSSGGSAAAVAARMAPLAIAEDTGGSIRVPASWCGICGLRPTYARYPDAGIMPLTEDKFDQVGAVARSVEDLLLFDSAVTGDTAAVTPAAVKGARIGIPNQLVTNLEPDVERTFAAAIQRLEAEGATVVRLDMPEVARVIEIAGAIIQFERVPAITGFLVAEGTGVTYEQLMAAAGEDIKAMAPQPPRAAYEAALQARAVFQDAVRKRFAEHDVVALAYPTTFDDAPKIGDTDAVVWQGQPVPRVVAIGRSTFFAPCGGHPGLVLPAGLGTNGLPVGIEFDTLPGTDRQLLSLGLTIEKVLGAIPAPAG